MEKELVFIGLGRMGAAMTARLVEQGYTVHGFDVSDTARAEAEKNGVRTYASIEEAISSMENRKVVWLMVPAKFVDSALKDIHEHLQADDIIIDGGNTFFEDTKRRAQDAAVKDIHYIDCGTSGGVSGARHGASLMVGGEKEAVKNVEDIFIALATPEGYGHVGGSGAGHFVKMVHNGIEYGMMGAIAEGMSFIEQHQAELNLNPEETLKPFEHGSIISSSLMSWMAEAYRDTEFLNSIAGQVPRGETEMEMEYIIAQNQTPVLQAALLQRKDTREFPSRTGTFISAMRNVFGGHKTIEK